MRELSNINEANWKTAKEIYTDAGVKKLTWDRFIKTLRNIDVSQKINRSNRNGGPLFSLEVEKQFQMWLMRNQANQGRSSQLVKETVQDSVDEYKYTKEDICKLCEVSISSFEHFAPQSITERDFIVFGSSHKKLYNEDVIKQFQMWLMRNQANQGRSSQLVKETTTTAVSNDIALKEIINSGNVEAMQCLMEHYVNETRAVGEAKRLEQINRQLQLENKQKDSTIVQLTEENDHLKKANDFTTAQLGYYRKKYHSYYDDYEIY